MQKLGMVRIMGFAWKKTLVWHEQSHLQKTTPLSLISQVVADHCISLSFATPLPGENNTDPAWMAAHKKNPSPLSLISQTVVKPRGGPLCCHEFFHTLLGTITLIRH